MDIPKHCFGKVIVNKYAYRYMCVCELCMYVMCIGGELYETVGVEEPLLLPYTHTNWWNSCGGPPTRCRRSNMGVSFICVGVRQQYGCFDTHTFLQFSTMVVCASSCARICARGLQNMQVITHTWPLTMINHWPLRPLEIPVSFSSTIFFTTELNKKNNSRQLWIRPRMRFYQNSCP